MMTLFICHATKDKPLVRKIKADLERHGIKVWLDETEIRVGDSLVETIENGLKTSDYAIIALSATAMNRPWVRKELNILLNMEIEREKKFIFPVLLEQTELPLFLKDKKYADFSKSYKSGFAELIAAIHGPGPSHLQQFEVMSSTVYLKILRRDGSLANAVKKQKLKCRKPVDSYTIATYSDGELRNFHATPGRY